MAISFPLTASQPFSITLPSTATVNSAGEVVCDLSANATEAMAAAVAAQDSADAAQITADDAVIDAAVAQATADAAVPKSGIVCLGPIRVSLINTANGLTYSFRPGFAGTFVNASMVLDGAETATGDAGVTFEITNGAVTLTAPLEQPSGTGAKIALTVTTSGGPWVFTDTDFITVIADTTNTAATFGGITLGVTRS